MHVEFDNDFSQINQEKCKASKHKLENKMKIMHKTILTESVL